MHGVLQSFDIYLPPCSWKTTWSNCWQDLTGLNPVFFLEEAQSPGRTTWMGKVIPVSIYCPVPSLLFPKRASCEELGTLISSQLPSTGRGVPLVFLHRGIQLHQLFSEPASTSPCLGSLGELPGCNHECISLKTVESWNHRIIETQGWKGPTR